MENIKTHSKKVRLLFFWIGVIATLSYRAVIVFNFYSNTLVKIFWYIGTIGFIIAVLFNEYLKKKNSGRVYFPFQKVVIPVGLLAILSLALYLIYTYKLF